MSFVSLPFGLLQGGQFTSGRVLKTYLGGTLTATPMYTDRTGGTSSATILYNSDDLPTVSSTVIAPHIDTSVGLIKYVLYPTQAAADADTGALQTWDNIDSLPPESGKVFYTSEHATFSAAITAASGGVLYIDDQNVVASNITVTDVIIRGGGGLIDPDSGVVVTLNTVVENGASALFDSTAAGTIRGQIKAKEVLVEWWGAVADGDGAGAGTDNDVAIQDCLDYFLAAGGTLSFGSPGGIYRVDTALTLKRTASGNAKTFVIQGNGAELDFKNLTGSAVGLTVGADASNSKDDGLISIRDLSLGGPETLDPSVSASPPTPDNEATTTTTGLNLFYALNVNLENIQVYNFYRGVMTEFVFPLIANQVDIKSCFIGLEHRTGSNAQTWNGLSVENARHSVVADLSASVGSSRTIDMITYLTPRIEGGINGFIFDASNTASAEIKGIGIFNPFMNTLGGDHFWLNKTYVYANGTPGSDRTVGKTDSFTLIGGRYSYSSTMFEGATNSTNTRVHIAASIGKANIAGNFPYGTLILNGNAGGGNDADATSYFYNSDGTEYFHIEHGATAKIGMNTEVIGGLMNLRKDQNSDTFGATKNDNSGTAASTTLRADSVNAIAYMRAYGSGFTGKSNDIEIGSVGAHNVYFANSNGRVGGFDTTGNFFAGNLASLATDATDGFLYIPNCPGTPTGTPTTLTGKTAMVYDTTGNKIWFYDGGWIGVGVS